MNEIKEETKKTSLVSVKNEAVDVFVKSQLPFVLRYSTPYGSVQEMLLRFPDINGDRSTAFFSGLVYKLINEFPCDEKLIAQIRLQQLWRMNIMYCKD
jgi:hypothetical protein